mmetsp:Transcript_8510/g.11746  ORF Transcript_8510/g.11746 Transcript_8510/m.11746 type:complete len:111 (+) Transcript_8510:236-568(+)
MTKNKLVAQWMDALLMHLSKRLLSALVDVMLWILAAIVLLFLAVDGVMSLLVLLVVWKPWMVWLLKVAPFLLLELANFLVRHVTAANNAHQLAVKGVNGATRPTLVTLWA